MSSTSVVNLKPSQIYTVSSSNQRISGSTASESVIISSGVWNTVVDAAVEKVQLAVGLVNVLTFTQNGQVLFYAPGQGLALSLSPAVSGTQLIFGDGNVATYTSTAKGITVHYDNLCLPLNGSVWLPNGDISVHGASGTETVRIPQGIQNVTIDNAVEQVNFAQPFLPTSITSGVGFIKIANSFGDTVAQLSLAKGHSETLTFANAVGIAGLDSSGMGLFTLAKVILNSNQNFTPNQSNLEIDGNRGFETVTLYEGLTNETIDSKIEKVAFALGHNNYTFKTGTNDLQVFNAARVMVADIFVSSSGAGTKLQFPDANYTALFTNGAINLIPEGASNPSTPVSPSVGSSNFKYSIDWGNFGTSQSGIQACMNKALSDLGKFFNAKGVLDLQVLPENVSSNVLAEASGAMVKTSATSESLEFQVESTTGTDANGNSYDGTVYINLTNLNKLNLDPTKAPTAVQYDLTTILEHELLHALGFMGNIGSSSSLSTPYDKWITTINGLPFFTGPHAQAVYGGPVPLAPANAGAGSAFYHVNLPNDLMNPSIGTGQIRSVSNLDLAILQDVGDPILIGVVT